VKPFHTNHNIEQTTSTFCYKKKQQLMQNAKATHLYMNEKGQRLSTIKSYDLENGNKRE